MRDSAVSLQIIGPMLGVSALPMSVNRASSVSRETMVLAPAYRAALISAGAFDSPLFTNALSAVFAGAAGFSPFCYKSPLAEWRGEACDHGKKTLIHDSLHDQARPFLLALNRTAPVTVRAFRDLVEPWIQFLTARGLGQPRSLSACPRNDRLAQDTYSVSGALCRQRFRERMQLFAIMGRIAW
jgi:hypothetical protein